MSLSLQSVPVRFSFESVEDRNAYIREELKKPGVHIYFDEDIIGGAAIHQAVVVVEQGVLHAAVEEEAMEVVPPAVVEPPQEEAIPQAVAPPAVVEPPQEEVEEAPEPEYNADGTYKHRGYKERYTPFDKDVGEGAKVQSMFIAMHLGQLKRNYAFETKEDPLIPPNYHTKLPLLFGTGTEKVTVNDKFFRYAINEYHKHQSKRILAGEERSNCFKKGASKRWTKADHKSTRINAVKLPPKSDAYLPSLGGC